VSHDWRPTDEMASTRKQIKPNQKKAGRNRDIPPVAKFFISEHSPGWSGILVFFLLLSFSLFFWFFFFFFFVGPVLSFSLTQPFCAFFLSLCLFFCLYLRAVRLTLFLRRYQGQPRAVCVRGRRAEITVSSAVISVLIFGVGWPFNSGRAVRCCLFLNPTRL